VGVERADHFTAPTTAIVINYKTKTQPWAVAGGTPGQKNTVLVRPGTPDQKEVGVSTNYFESNEGITNLTGGGGGWGDPLKRDPAKVLNDVIDGFVTADKARSDYGVVLSADGLSIDESATLDLRNELAGIK
jgi:N-methylhydantoinase B